jgi:hypothetical protein
MLAIPTKAKRLAMQALAFGMTHKAEVAAVAALLVSLPIPAPYHAALTLVAMAAAAIAGTKYPTA